MIATRALLPISAIAGLIACSGVGQHQAATQPASAVLGATLDRGGSAVIVTSLQSGRATPFQVGDRIERIDGEPVHSPDAVRRAIARAGGRTIDVRVWRGGRLKDIKVGTLGG